jgi:alcohol dehydrogenase/propanol-preferring alcohol dehydrogenase
MSSSTQHAWVVVEHGKPLQKIEIPIPETTGTEILIKVTHCGVCHSDLHFWEGFYDLGGGKRLHVKDRGAKLPRALGHEILGTVAKLGPDADQSVPIGVSRIVYPWVGCQKCDHCQDEDDNLCVGQVIRGVFSNGGFAQYVTIPHARYLVDYGNVDPSSACTFGCSGLTVLSSIQKLMPLKPEEPVLLVGAGGLGLACISMLHALGHKKIVTADISPEKLQAALDAGATAVVNSKTEEDAAKVAMQVAGGPFSGAIDFVCNKQTAEFAMASVGKGGKVVTVGIMGGEMAISLVPFTFGSKSLLGNITGTPQHLRDVSKIAQSGKLKEIPITEVPWDQANDALQRLYQGKVTGRLVLIH